MSIFLLGSVAFEQLVQDSVGLVKHVDEWHIGTSSRAGMTATLKQTRMLAGRMHTACLLLYGGLCLRGLPNRDPAGQRPFQK